ncbi:carboxypeptidase-like regulatory domain-containing protein [Candidatus Palauibacter sp.]|uniref:carboxypeptidase-like regulatory domain-containing protein n=1 Tax=Candidatus Palauibacter sp. TaxID=3101350 RepID=UPI003CC56040
MTGRRAALRAAIAVVLGLALLTPPVAAQERVARLSGVLVSEGDGAPVDGAVVSLVDLNDVVVWETLSNGSGAFSLPLPPPGTYRVRVSRIGYESWTSGAIHVAAPAESRTLRFEIPVRPVPLPELMVTEQNDCPTTPEERRRAFELYESVLPILASASHTEDLGRLRMSMVRPAKVWRRGGFRYVPDTAMVVVPRALDNASPGYLEAHGYAEAINDSLTTFYAPDGDALASPGFLATHCLSTRKAGDEGTVGLAFEPRPGREVVDVKGVLWIDKAAREPRELEFQYTSLRPFLRQHLLPTLTAHVLSRIPEGLRVRRAFHPIELADTDFGGRVRFGRIDGGPWFIREWKIVRPELAIFSLSEAGRTIGRLTVWPRAVPLEYSGEVLAIVP